MTTSAQSTDQLGSVSIPVLATFWAPWWLPFKERGAVLAYNNGWPALQLSEDSVSVRVFVTHTIAVGDIASYSVAPDTLLLNVFVLTLRCTNGAMFTVKYSDATEHHEVITSYMEQYGVALR